MDSREEIIRRYIKGKEVLDLGVGDTSDRFLHRFIKKYAKKTMGVELDPKRAESLRKKGYDIRDGNAENIRINKKFDIIVAGVLIEHLDNPGLFLENVKKHLKKGGLFLMNTPNIYSINFTLRSFFQGGNVKHFHEHTMGFTEQLLKELFSRHNLKIVKVIYFSHKNNFKSLIIGLFSALSKKWNENIFIVAK